jgi:hypothetical protein
MREIRQSGSMRGRRKRCGPAAARLCPTLRSPHVEEAFFRMLCRSPNPEQSSLAGFLVITYGRIGVIPEVLKKVGWHRAFIILRWNEKPDVSAREQNQAWVGSILRFVERLR